MYVPTWIGFVFVAIRYSERLAEEGIDPSIASVGDSYGQRDGRIDHRAVHRRFSSGYVNPE